MKLERLKNVRVGVSLAFFFLTAFLFMDFTGAFSPEVTGWITFLQFAPSLVNALHGVGLAAAGFAIVLVLTVLFGRVYCSTICPLGTLQDLVSYVARRRNRHRWYRRRPPGAILRYTLLGATVLLFAAGSGLLVTLLDPFSNFGRIIAALARPLVIGANNGIATVADLMHLYALYRVPLAGLTWPSVGVALAVLGLVGVLAYRHGRLYCNTVCPVGTLLGLAARVAVFRIAVREETCTDCGLCERVCKSSCIDMNAHAVDLTRCVGCFNCFTVCRSGAMVMQRAGRRERNGEPAAPNRVRRRIVVGALAAFGGIRALAQEKKILAPRPTTIPEKREHPVAPPGAGSIQHFTDTCTACHLCVSACPSRVLEPSFLQYGIGGILQPRMAYDAGYCNFECVTCGQICPTGAILPLAVDQKKVAQLGVAKFIKESCVVETDNTDCGACSEHCPTKAVQMVPYKGKLLIPEVTTDYCVGCGACEHACPTRPYRAIYVDGHPVHAVAKKKEEKKIDEKPAFEGDFPF